MLKTILSWTLLGGLTTGVTAGTPDYYAQETQPGNYVKHIDVQGRTREYRLHVPAHYDGSRRMPVVLVFHGSSASASVIERETAMNVRADSLGFFIVYPDGLHRAWNIGECCHYSFTHHVDETAFAGAILDQLTEGYAADTTRFYSTGYSDGATLSYLLACNIPNRIAAVAGISGTLFNPQPRCQLPHALSVMIVHGTGDHHIPYDGSRGGPAAGKGDHFTYSAPAVTEFWTGRNGCTAPPDSVQHGTVIRKQYSCSDGAEVLFYTIIGGSHGWPGGGRGWIFSPRPPKDMVATDTVVQFFLRHRLGA